MIDAHAQPILFVKHGCPFCLKVRLYLLEAGIIDSVVLRESRTPEEDATLKADLASHLPKVSFPAARFGSEYIAGSDEIIRRFHQAGARAPEQLATLQAYVDGPFTQLQALYRENAELKQRA